MRACATKPPHAFEFDMLALFQQALHEGYLASGVPGWGTAYQYTSVCESDPDRIVTFLTSRAREQAQQAQQYAEVGRADGRGWSLH